MWIEPPEPTQAQRDRGNEMARRVLAIQRAKRREQERQQIRESISTDELSSEELRAYVNSLLD